MTTRRSARGRDAACRYERLTARDATRVDVEEPEVQALKEAFSGSDVVITTGLVPQELLARLGLAPAMTYSVYRDHVRHVRTDCTKQNQGVGDCALPEI